MIKNVALSLTIVIFQLSAFAQEKQETVNTALLIIDIQNFYFPGEGPGLVNAEGSSFKAKEVLQIFREKEHLVVHVRHKAEEGFEIHENVAPLGNEKVFTKTEINSFHGTDLLEYLQKKDVNRLVIVGMQTQMCVEAATRAAHDFGFECILISDACATRDVKFGDQMVKAADVQSSTLATLAEGGYARVIDLNIFEGKTNYFLRQELD